MKIILREDVEKLGKAGEIVKVKDGYGRNYLIPLKLAVLANVRNMKALDHDRRTIETRAKKTRKTSEAMAATLSAVSLTLPAKAGEEGKLFGAITSRDIAEALGKAGLTIDRKAIQLADPIKQVGDYKVKIRVAADVFPEISVSVVPEDLAASRIHSGRGASMDENRSTTPGGNDASLRVPPHDLHAEQAVLASVLLNNDLINGVMEVLRPGDFYQGAHRILYEAMVDLYDRGRPIDQLTLSAVLKDRNAEQQVGGLAYLSEIVTSVPISDNVVHYARIVKEKSILRKTISAAQEITTAAFQGVADIDVFLDRTEQAIFAIAEEKIRPSYYVMGEMAREAMKEIEEAYERKERITGVASGFRDLDQVTAGFQRSNMIVVAARPGMGKTSLCLNIAVNAATRQKLPVAIFSLEMSRQELAMRMICSEARVNFQRLRTGHLAQEEVNRLVAAVGKLSEAPIYTDDSGTLSAMELRAKARRLKKERGIGMIIVDYLQLMHGSNTRQNSENRVQEVSEISRSMKSLAKELNIPVVAVSQLSRGVESRNDKRPQMADLRESGAIEQDSDLILFVYREEMYAKEKTPQEAKGVAEIILGKNRSGPMRDVKLAFLSQFTRFEDLAQDLE